MARASAILAAVMVAAVTAGCAAVDPMTAPASGAPPSSAGEDGQRPAIEVLLRLASATARAGDAVTAASLYRRAHGLDPKNLVAALGLARILARLGAFDEAADVYRAALALRPDDAEALRGYGNVLVALGQPAGAVVQFEKAMTGPDDARLYNGLGVAYDRLNDHGMAQAYYRTGLDIDPGNLALGNNLGLSLALSGRLQEAVKVLRRVAADPRASTRQRLNLALALGLAGETEAAAEIARMDLDEDAVQANLAYYETLRALEDPKATAAALGTRIGGFDGAGPR